MIAATALPLGILACAVVVPLVREYASLRRDYGLGRAGALLASSLLLPALGVGLAAGLPLAGTPALQWAVTVAVTLAAYSAGVAALRPAAASAASRRSS